MKKVKSQNRHKHSLTTAPEAIKQKVKSVHIFAEVEPQQKERIIQALRKSYTVAYMGDGINDVSAMNAADIGISVKNSVDVAREAADVPACGGVLVAKSCALKA